MRRAVILSLSLFFSVSLALQAQDRSESKASPQDTPSEHHQVTAAHLIHKVSPEYPKKARKKHVEGTVRLHAIIAKDGTVTMLEVISGDPLLVDAALKAVRQWRYSPTLLDGRPVEVDTTIDVNFALNKTS
jgi:TonB family protein